MPLWEINIKKFNYKIIPIQYFDELEFLLLVFNDQNISFIDYIDNGVQFPDSYHSFGNKRRCEYLAGRISLKVLCNYPFLWEFFPNKNGAPTFPTGTNGSLSHSDNIVLAVIARSRDIVSIGVDIQHWITEDDFELIQESIVNINEIILIKDKKYLTIIFSAKESLIKGICNLFNIFLDFKELCVEKISLDKIYISLNSQKLKNENIQKIYIINYFFNRKGVVTFFQLKKLINTK